MSWLQELLILLDTNAYPDILHWLESGETFRILSVPAFQDVVLPRLGASMYRQFVKRLARYQFIFHGHPKNNIWSHPYFQRSSPHLLHSIVPQLEAYTNQARANAPPRALHLTQQHSQTLMHNANTVHAHMYHKHTNVIICGLHLLCSGICRYQLQRVSPQ